MAEPTDDELEAIKLQARESVDYAAAGCVRGSRMGLRLADAAERRALYKAGRQEVLDFLRADSDTARRLADEYERRLSCGCPPEHHDEAIRRAADPAERRALLARLTQQSLELGTYDKTAPKES